MLGAHSQIRNYMKAMDPDIWTAHRYINVPASDGGKTHIPDLISTTDGQQHKANTNESKGSLLANTFFPPHPEDKPTHSDNNPVKPVCKMDRIQTDQIKRQIQRLKPFKAPGPDGILNVVLNKCADILVDRLRYIYAAMIDKRLSYAPWKTFITVVI